MIKFYINAAQLYNFVDLKEPVQLITFAADDRYIEFFCNVKDVRIITYQSYSTIELMTRRKRRKARWQRIKKKFTHKKI